MGYRRFNGSCEFRNGPMSERAVIVLNRKSPLDLQFLNRPQRNSQEFGPECVRDGQADGRGKSWKKALRV